MIKINPFLEVDLCMLHAPSVYDFRKNSTLFGPISDVIPSSSVFEMYPVGFTSIADYLENNHYNVQIINLAYKMMVDEHYDVEKVIKSLKPKVFAIDLHWLPHCHGSIEVAKLVKKYHPTTPIIFGGLSSSYYHEELMEYPEIDFVVRGDSTEKPMLLLMDAIVNKSTFQTVPNLTWKDKSGQIQVNPLTNVPDDIDYVDIPSYRYVVRSVFKYGSLSNVLPYKGWLEYPTTALLTARGCTQNCAICGGSKFALNNFCNRQKPAYRSPRVLLEDIKSIQAFSRAPIFIIHDIRQAGETYWRQFLKGLSEMEVKNELVFELFYPADDEFFGEIKKAVPAFSLELTLESSDETIRRFNGKFKCTNEQVESTIASALAHGCRKIDIFFMVGIPDQTYQSAMENIDYAGELLNKFNSDPRLCFFIAPLAPFLDPGCLAFEDPEKYGYKKFCHSLEDHRKALLNPSWKQILSFETKDLTRDQIVNGTYEAALRLNQLKFDHKLISQEDYQNIKFKIENSLIILNKIDEIIALNLPEEEKNNRMLALKKEVDSLNRFIVCGEKELLWKLDKPLANLFSISKLLFSALGDEFSLSLKRIQKSVASWF